ncbi:MAG TPA: VWA domain-containing protein [Methylotenera sp.]|nr:VWA domain-containing protein [Methylotenera sp.]HPH06544.1 VWA domain-containing protein [Methylotenera sp.]HPN01802.1 VWA domain-containing protein [Methylotenera sp.]
MSQFHWFKPEILWLLPLALLPLLTHGIKRFPFPSLQDWPQDRASRLLQWAARGLASLALVCLIIAAAAPYREGGVTSKIGEGAEIVVVLDRSGSMSEGLKGRDYNRQAAEAHESDAHFLSKIEASRAVLLKFMQARPADTFGLVVFNAAPISVAPLSSDRALPEAALLSAQSQSTGFTALGRALGLALDYFEGRPHTATRLILLVSDGDALIEEEDQQILKQAFARQRAQLMWIYVRGERELSILDSVIAGDNEYITQADKDYAARKQSASMHEVFGQLGVPYQAFEVDSEEGFNSAIAAVSHATNKPTRYEYRLPRQDFGQYFYILTLMLLAAMFWLKKSEIQFWRPHHAH